MEQSGEKTEQATPRRLEEAVKQGQFARSAEVQTVFVVMSGLLALQLTGSGLWHQLAGAQLAILGHLHEIPLSLDVLPGYALQGALVLGSCVGPVALAGLAGGLLAGAMQSRFQATSEALTPKWERLNPLTGLKRIFSVRSLTPTALSLLKLLAVAGISYGEVRRVLADPIFYSGVSVARISEFLAKSSLNIALYVGASLVVIAALDYTFQFWRTNRDVMMTREEVKEEMKNSEGDPHMKARQRRRRTLKTQRQMLQEVSTADVVVTNPTHIAVALRYDRKTMKAPRIVAKGTRLNALKIREVAGQHHIPIMENKPLARLMFKYGRVGGEIPAQLYAAVAEVLAYVYRVNRYRYYAEQNQA